MEHLRLFDTEAEFLTVNYPQTKDLWVCSKTAACG